MPIAQIQNYLLVELLKLLQKEQKQPGQQIGKDLCQPELMNCLFLKTSLKPGSGGF